MYNPAVVEVSRGARAVGSVFSPLPVSVVFRGDHLRHPLREGDGCSRERHVIFVYIRTRAARVGLKSRPIDPPPPWSVRLARALVERPMNLRKRIICTHEKRPCTHVHIFLSWYIRVTIFHARSLFTNIRFVSSYRHRPFLRPSCLNGLNARMSAVNICIYDIYYGKIKQNSHVPPPQSFYL